MQKMNTHLLRGFAKLVFLFTPAVAVVFALLYFGDAFLIKHGLGHFLFVPAVVALAISFLLFHRILGPTMAELKKNHLAQKDGKGP
jgi:hypothetical protein